MSIRQYPNKEKAIEILNNCILNNECLKNYVLISRATDTVDIKNAEKGIFTSTCYTSDLSVESWVSYIKKAAQDEEKRCEQLKFEFKAIEILENYFAKTELNYTAICYRGDFRVTNRESKESIKICIDAKMTEKELIDLVQNKIKLAEDYTKKIAEQNRRSEIVKTFCKKNQKDIKIFIKKNLAEAKVENRDVSNYRQKVAGTRYNKFKSTLEGFTIFETVTGYENTTTSIFPNFEVVEKGMDAVLLEIKQKTADYIVSHFQRKSEYEANQIEKEKQVEIDMQNEKDAAILQLEDTLNKLAVKIDNKASKLLKEEIARIKSDPNFDLEKWKEETYQEPTEKEHENYGEKLADEQQENGMHRLLTKNLLTNMGEANARFQQNQILKTIIEKSLTEDQKARIFELKKQIMKNMLKISDNKEKNDANNLLEIQIKQIENEENTIKD